MSKRIKLTQGKYTTVDDEDYELLINSNFKWYCTYSHGHHYAFGQHAGTYIMLPRFLLNPKKGEQIDHIDRNGLNNKRDNLRIVSNRENQLNKKKPAHNTSGYKGVWWAKDRNKFRAEFYYKGQRYSLGSFDDPREAARAYDKKALEIVPEYVLTNKMLGLLNA